MSSVIILIIVAGYLYTTHQVKKQYQLHLDKAAMFVEQSDKEGALAELDGALAIAPNKYLPYLLKSVLVERDDTRIELLTQAITLAPRFDNKAIAKTRYARGTYYLRTNQLAEAISDFQTAIEARPRSPEVYLSLATAYNRQALQTSDSTVGSSLAAQVVEATENYYQYGGATSVQSLTQSIQAYSRQGDCITALLPVEQGSLLFPKDRRFE